MSKHLKGSHYGGPNPVLYDGNRGTLQLSEQNCFVVRATANGWSNPVYYQTTERWTCELMSATMFAEYEAAEAMVCELRFRPPAVGMGVHLFADRPVLDAVPLMGQLRRNRPHNLRNR